MRTPLLVGMVIATGCAQANRGSLPAAPLPAPTIDTIEVGCRYREVLDEERKPLPFMTHVDCPFPSGATPQMATWAATRSVASLAVLLQRELVFYRVDQIRTPGVWTVTVYLSPGGDDPMLPLLAKEPTIRGFQAVKAFSPDTYARLRAQAEVMKEDRAYDACKTLILDVAAAAADPTRADACARLMEVVDRSRAARQVQANHREIAAIERERVGAEQRSADAAETANALRRVGQIMQAFSRPSPTYTDCTTYGRSTNCVSR